MLGDVHVFCMLCCPSVNYIVWLCHILHICGMYMYRCMLYILLYMLCVYCVVFSNVRQCFVLYAMDTILLYCVVCAQCCLYAMYYIYGMLCIC